MKNHQLPQKVKLDRFKRRIASKKIKKSNYFDGTRQLSYTGVVRKSPWKAKKTDSIYRSSSARDYRLLQT